ncbi:polysaccharide deacetylase family protein [Microbacterium sp. LWH12-1.2]|uniref:polysaccharide deacetylase family protein n=1 Tax=Microbacterium sp. LWH12-1.2 TaxID=3135259 RepID=UPI00344002F1
MPMPTRMPMPVSTPTPTPVLPDPITIAARHHGVVPSAWGTHLPGVVSELVNPTDEHGAARVALTFDACGGSGGSNVDHALIDGLRAATVPATLFLNQRWVETHAELAAELAADPLFLLANHGTGHHPLSVTGAAAYGIPGTGSAAGAVDEVWSNHQVLTELVGHPPRYFRAGTAHYDDVAVRIVHELGEIPIGFTVNGDGGASYSASAVRHEFGRAAAGSIVLAHMNRPDGGTAAGALAAISDLRAHGVRFVHVDA